MTRVSKLLMLFVLGLSLVGCGGGGDDIQLPDAAIADDVMLLVWVDVQQLDPASIKSTVNSVISKMPAEVPQADRDKMQQEFEDAMPEYEKMYAKFTNAGAQGVLVGMKAPKSLMGKPESFMLIRADQSATPEALVAAVESLPDAPPVDFKIEPFAPGWMVVTDSENEMTKPSGGSAEATSAYAEVMSQAGGAPFRVAIRPGDEIKKMAKDQAQGNPMAAGAAKSVEKFQWMLIAGHLGDDPRMDMTAMFEDQESAKMFADVIEGILSMVKMQAAGSPDAEAKAAAAMLNQINLVHDGRELSMTLSANSLLPVMGPSILKSRQRAQQAASASNLRGLGQALYIHANDHDDQYPDDLAVLIVEDILTPQMLVHPASGKKVPGNPADLTEQARWAAANSDYVYIKGKTANMRGDEALAYEKPGQPWTSEGINVLFGDTSVRFLDYEDDADELERLGIKVR